MAVVAVAVLATACTSSSTDPEAQPITTATPTPPETAMPEPGEQADLDRRLRDAAWADDVAAARDLIARGADVNAKDETQQSAYLVTTSEGYLDLLNLTLAHGGDVASKDSFNGPA